MSEPGEALSDRELEVLRLLPSGASNKSIAEELSISPYTVKTHLRNIFAKLDVSTRTEAITVAMQQGVLAVPGETAAEEDNDPALAPLATDPAPLAPVVEATAEPTPVTVAAPRRRSPWLYLGPALLLLLGVLGAVYWFTQQPSGQAATPAPLFAEEPIGDSRWLTSRPLPEPRVSQAIASVGLDIYHIGGETAAGVTNDVWAYDTGSRLWTEAAAKPAAVADTTAAELFGEIYVPGGRQPDGQPTNLVEAYSPTQDAWRRVAPLPQPLSGALTLADGGFLYVIGGQGPDGALDTVYVYDPGADTWRPVAPLPAPRALAAGAALTGQLVVVGGTDGTAAQATCFTYSPAADVWQTCPDMLAARAGAGATVVLNKLYVVGGTSGQDSTGANGEIYDPNSQIWQVLTVPPELAAWQQPGVVHVENRLFAQGGRRGEALSDANLIYSPFVFQSFIPAASSGSGE